MQTFHSTKMSTVIRKAYILCEHANTHRCIDSRKTLESIGFQVICVPYTRHDDKVISNKVSMQGIYQDILDKGDPWSYVFEDDIAKLTDITLDEIIEYEGISSHVFYLGTCCINRGMSNSGISIRGHPVITLAGGCHGLHAIALSQDGARELLAYSRKAKERYMDVILRDYTVLRPAHVVRHDLCYPGAHGHRGAICQNRNVYPTTI
jgi:hypothetical protein